MDTPEQRADYVLATPCEPDVLRRRIVVELTDAAINARNEALDFAAQIVEQCEQDFPLSEIATSLRSHVTAK